MADGDSIDPTPEPDGRAERQETPMTIETEQHDLASTLRHRTGCPSDGEPVGQRVEQFTTQDGEGRPTTVCRCCDCGEQVLSRDVPGLS